MSDETKNRDWCAEASRQRDRADRAEARLREMESVLKVASQMVSDASEALRAHLSASEPEADDRPILKHVWQRQGDQLAKDVPELKTKVSAAGSPINDGAEGSKPVFVGVMRNTSMTVEMFTWSEVLRMDDQFILAQKSTATFPVVVARAWHVTVAGDVDIPEKKGALVEPCRVTHKGKSFEDWSLVLWREDSEVFAEFLASDKAPIPRSGMVATHWQGDYTVVFKEPREFVK